MSLEEHEIKDLKANIKYPKNKLPICKHEALTPCFFVYTSIGMKHSGKTVSFTSLIKLYEQYGFYNPITEEKMKIRTILVSPTAHFSSNSIIHQIDSLDEDDIYTENVTEQTLKDIFNQLVAEKELIKNKSDYIKAYKHFIKVKDVMYLTDDEIMVLSQYDFQKPSEIFKGVEDYIYFLILDDLISDNNIFNQKRSSFISNLVIKHRHYQINLIFTTQSLKSIPKIIRNNTDVLQFFKSSSNKVIDEYYEMVSNNLSKEEFLTLYEYATSEKYSSLIVNNHPKCKYKYLKNWNTYLSINGKM